MSGQVMTRKQIDQLLDQLCGYEGQAKLEVITLPDEIIIRKHARKRQLKELKGLGKHLWFGYDVDKYLQEERNSWER